MSQIRRIQRNIRRRSGDAPNARLDAILRVVPLINALVTDRDLSRARYRMPLDVARSRARTKAWAAAIDRRLAMPEHKRIAQAGGAV